MWLRGRWRGLCMGLGVVLCDGSWEWVGIVYIWNLGLCGETEHEKLTRVLCPCATVILFSRISVAWKLTF